MKLHASISDKIEKGTIIATVQQPELLQKIEDAKAIIAEQKLEMNKLVSYG
ncbi:hypothetical protein SAMN04488069_1321, partial [Hymenobacter psychrophilus]